jgi:hypothetical protein
LPVNVASRLGSTLGQRGEAAGDSVRWPTRRDQLLAGGDKGGGASSDRNGIPHYPRTSPHRPQVSPRSATCLACEHGRRRPRSRSGQWRRRALRLVDARRDAAAEHAAARERIRAPESLKARQLVEHFGREGVARGSRRTPLRARAYNGHSTYGTPLRGWYLKRNGSLAVDGDANFYVMSTATSFRARITRADVAPTDPPLMIG